MLEPKTAVSLARAIVAGEASRNDESILRLARMVLAEAEKPGAETTAVEAHPISVPDCDLCGEVQTELGALLFSPPSKTLPVLVAKKHVCVWCYGELDQLRQTL